MNGHDVGQDFLVDQSEESRAGGCWDDRLVICANGIEALGRNSPIGGVQIKTLLQRESAEVGWPRQD